MSHEVKAQSLEPPAWLNREFIQTALRTGDADPSISVLSVDFAMANSSGDGNGSDMYRAIAQLSSSQERRVVIKCVPQVAGREEFINRTGVFDKEIKMLSETLPAMSKILEEAIPSDYRELSAKCLYHGDNPVQFMVLEDLRHSGYTLVNKRIGLDLPHCKLALKALARFHASSLALLKQDPTALQTYEKPLYTEKLRQDFAPFFVNMLQNLEKIVLEWPGYEKFSEKIKKIEENVYDTLVQLLSVKDEELKTLIHADVWPGNLMFKYRDSCVADIKLVDFQLSYYSSPALDIQHFLAQCPNEEVRENWTDSLIEEYHRIFSETLDLLHCSEYKMTFDKFKNDLDKHSLYGLLITAVYLPLTLSDPTGGWDIDDFLSKDGSVHNSWDDVMKRDPYKKVMKKLLVKCENLGFI